MSSNKPYDILSSPLEGASRRQRRRGLGESQDPPGPGSAEVFTIAAALLGGSALISHFTADDLDDATDGPEDGAASHPTEQEVELSASPEELGERDDESVEEGTDDQADMQADAADEAEETLSSEDAEEDVQRENEEEDTSPFDKYVKE